MTHKSWDTYRTKRGGKGRITYHPEWSATHPWAVYVNGTALCHLPDLLSAVIYFWQRHKMRLNLKRLS
jgi:hypothetical protein